MDFEFLTVPETVSTLDPIFYQYFHQLLNRRTIVFNRDIDENVVEYVYMPLKEFEEDSNSAPVTLILNSSGGSVSDGFFLAHYLTHYKKKLNIIVTGYAASMATVILAAGGKNENIHRMCYPSSYALIHDGYVALSASETKTAADIMTFNDTVDKSVRDFILNNTSLSAEQYDSKSRHQWFLTAQEMLDCNLVDEILGSDK